MGVYVYCKQGIEFCGCKGTKDTRLEFKDQLRAEFCAFVAIYGG